jgi:YidC/Oxa1 family membrane protein insertase
MNDKNSVIGISLMVLLTVLYFVFAPRPEPKQPDPAQQEEAINSTPQSPVTLSDTAASSIAEVADLDSIKNMQLTSQYGQFADLMQGEEKLITVNTDLLSLKISTLGGKIVEARLKNHQTYDSLPLPIISEELNHDLTFEFINKNTSQVVNSGELYFTPSLDREIKVAGESTQTLVMEAKISEGRYLQQVYTIKGDKYDVGYEIKMVGMQSVMKNRYYELRWTADVPKTEKDIKPQRQKTQIVYMQGDDLENLGGMSEDPEEENVKGEVNWISFKSQFFSHALIAKNEPMRAPILAIETPMGSDRISKHMEADFQMDVLSDESSHEFLMYMGPNEYKTLRSYDVKLQKQMDLGYLFISQINIVTIYVFKFFERYIDNYGLIILLFAILIKLIVFPMTYKSFVSMAKLRVLNGMPEMKAIDEKHKDDPQKQQMEKMAIYRKMKVSPLGGCLPMLLQWPILISMFFFFPQSIELRQKSFLWATDLSTYDSVLDLPFTIPGYGDHVSLFTILMAVSIYIYTYFQQKSQPTNAAMPFMKYLPYLFPIIFVIFLNNYSSGLSWYYFAANIISIIQTTSIRASLNDEKLMAEMRSATKKKKGKGGKGGKKGGGGGSSSSGKSRLERWVEKQQKKQEETMKARQQAKGGNNRRSRRKR